MTDREAMKLALFALDIVKIHYTQSRHINEAITALKERLAQPEPIQSLQCFNCQVTIETLNDKVMHLLAQRTWVGLTEEDYVLVNQLCINPIQAAEFVDRLLKEKNT